MHPQNIVILGTGGTIAGRAASASDNIGYTAAQVGVEELLAAIPPWRRPARCSRSRWRRSTART